MSVTTDVVLVRDKSLAAADLDGCIVLLNVRAGAYFRFNGVATEIWHLLAEPCQVGEIFDALSQTHNVDTATLSRDVLPFLQRLLEQGLAREIDRKGGR